MFCFTSRESSEDPIYEDIDSLETSLSSIDNLHAVQEENTCDTYSKVHVVCAIIILLQYSIYMTIWGLFPQLTQTNDF